MSSYTPYHKKYYESHKTEISVKTKSYWNSYYEQNKEAIRLKNLNRYYDRKARLAALENPPAPNPPATNPPDPNPPV